MPGVNVLATYRGCYNQPEDEIMKNVITYKAKVKKLNFRWCNSTLCNNANRISYDTSVLFYFFIFYVAKLLN